MDTVDCIILDFAISLALLGCGCFCIICII